MMASSLQPGPVELPANARFRNPDSAKLTLERICRRIPHDVAESLLTFLPAAPNADAALAQFDRLLDHNSPEFLLLLQKFPFLVHYAVLLFGFSEWIGETLIRNEDLFRGFVRQRKGLHRARSVEDYAGRLARIRAANTEVGLAPLLARFKRREYARIVLRDMLGIATLSDVTAEISCLADVIVEAALRETELQLAGQIASRDTRNPVSRPRSSRFAVLSLGKLGGNELNYSSDIDLMYLYDADLSDASAELTPREYFIRLAQQTTELLSQHTPAGPVFRIDLRLRPQGSQEELAISLPHAVRYYREVAHDWELQALIKARHTAGDESLSREFIRAVEPQVYRPALNFTAIKTALQSREKIDKHRRRHPPVPSALKAIDVKLDRGGIRDIEFLVQCLQRVYGGSERWLRSRGTLFALQKLHDKQHIGGRDFHNLNDTYVFLRNIEHRLQLWQGHQTHRLVISPPDLELMARSMAREGTAIPDSEGFVAQVRNRMAQVAEMYNRVVFEQEAQSQHDGQPEVEDTRRSALTGHYRQLMQRIGLQSSATNHALETAQLSQHGQRNLERFLTSAVTSGERFAGVMQSTPSMTRALQVFEHSDLLSSVLARNPAEIAQLDAVASSVDDCGAPNKLLPEPLLAHFAAAGSARAERKESLGALRRDFRQLMFLSSARDVFCTRTAYAAMAEKTAIADAVISAVLTLTPSTEGFAVLALGRLGSCEFDVLSDSDLLFVADEAVPRERARHIAEQVVQALTLYMREGALMAVDTRLRPHGNAGELVATPSQLRSYFAAEAKPWEALTYLRLRFVAGDVIVAAAALEAVQRELPSLAARSAFDRELADIRTKLEKSDPRPNLKTGPGGVYDIDYIVGTLQIRNNLFRAANLHDRISQVEAANILGSADAAMLQQSALFLRSLEHAIRLATGHASKWLPDADHARRSIAHLLAGLLADGESLEPRVEAVVRQNRELYEKHQKSC